MSAIEQIFGVQEGKVALVSRLARRHTAHGEPRGRTFRAPRHPRAVWRCCASNWLHCAGTNCGAGDLMKAVLFHVSPASDLITGQTLYLDCGITATQWLVDRPSAVDHQYVTVSSKVLRPMASVSA